MENETVNQVTDEAKTFTQEEVNAIVGERLKRAEAKYGDYEELKEKALKLDQIEEANKSELEKITEKAANLQSELDAMKKAESIRAIREKVSNETGIPLNLLTADTEEACMEQATAIKAYAVPNSYPQVKDAGEPQIRGKGSARDDFAAWANAVNN